MHKERRLIRMRIRELLMVAKSGCVSAHFSRGQNSFAWMCVSVGTLVGCNAATAASVCVSQMEVGIEDCLHIEFEYGKGVYSLKETVVGKIYFLLVRIKLKHMEIEIRRRETTGSGASMHNESETLAKYEIMDGAPVRGENVPIRLFLSPYDLTPTYKNVNNKFSVRYYLNLVLVDEEERRYFKQQEIQLYRKREDGIEK